MITLWGMVRCLEEGTKYPTKLSPGEVSSFTGMGLWFV